MLLKRFLVVLSFLFSGFTFGETVWIDVRNLEEHNADNINGDLRVTHSNILSKVAVLYPDKETDIHLYCRSGRRAGVAKSILEDAGYLNIFNSGGIEEVKKERNIQK